MIKNLILIVLYFLISLFTTQAQDIQKHESEIMMDSLFSTGTEGYRKLLKEHFNETLKSNKNTIEGFQIVKIQFDNQGNGAARFMTYVEDKIEDTWSKFVEDSYNYWVFDGVPYEIYVVFYFGKDLFMPGNIVQFDSSFPKKLSPPFAPFSQYVYNTFYKDRSFSVKMEDEDGRNRPIKEIAREMIKKRDRLEDKYPLDSSRHSAFQEASQKAYSKLESNYNDALLKKNEKKILKAVTELIKYNPFNLELLIKRVEMEKILGLNKYTPFDIPWIVTLRKMKAKGQMKID